MIVCHSIVTVGGGGGETVRGVEAVREAETVFVRSLIMVYSLASNFFYVFSKVFSKVFSMFL